MTSQSRGSGAPSLAPPPLSAAAAPSALAGRRPISSSMISADILRACTHCQGEHCTLCSTMSEGRRP